MMSKRLKSYTQTLILIQIIKGIMPIDKFDRDSFNLWAESDAEDTKDNKHS